MSTSKCKNLSTRVPTEAQEDAFRRRAAAIPCKQDDLIIDWSNGVLKTNVGEPSGVSARGEELLGEYFVMPPGTPPPSQWRVLEDCVVVPGGNHARLPNIVQKPNVSIKEQEPASLVAVRAPVQDTNLVLPSFVLDTVSRKEQEPASLVAVRAPVQESISVH